MSKGKSDPAALAALQNSLSVLLRSLSPDEAEALLSVVGDVTSVRDLRRAFGSDASVDRLQALIRRPTNGPRN